MFVFQLFGKCALLIVRLQSYKITQKLCTAAMVTKKLSTPPVKNLYTHLQGCLRYFS